MDLLTYALLHKQIVKGDIPSKTSVGVGKPLKKPQKNEASNGLVRAPLPSTLFAEVDTIYIDKTKTVTQVSDIIKNVGKEYPVVTMPEGIPYLYMVGVDKATSLAIMYAPVSALISQSPELSGQNVKSTDFLIGAMTIDLQTEEGILNILFSTAACTIPDLYDDTKTLTLSVGWQENAPDKLEVPSIPQAPALNRVGMALPWAPLLQDIFYVLKKPEPKKQLIDTTEVDRLYYYNKNGTLNFNKPAYPKISLDQLYDRANKKVAIGSDLDLSSCEGTAFTLDIPLINKIYINKLNDKEMARIAAEAKKIYKTKQSIYWESYSRDGILYPILAWGEPYNTYDPLGANSFNGGLFIGWLKENGDATATDDDFAIILMGDSFPSCLYASKSFRDPFGDYSAYVECQQGWNRTLTEKCIDFSWLTKENPEYTQLYSGLNEFVDQSLLDLFKNIFSQTDFVPVVADSIILKRLNYSADPVYPKTRYSDLILNDNLFLVADKILIPSENNKKVSQLYINTSVDTSVVSQQLARLNLPSGTTAEPILVLGTSDSPETLWGITLEFNFNTYYLTYVDNRSTDRVNLELFNSDTGWNTNFNISSIEFTPELITKTSVKPEVPDVVKDWLYLKPAGKSNKIQLYNPDTGENLYPKTTRSQLVEDDAVTPLHIADGKDGKDGISIAKIEKTKTEGLVDTYTITYSNDSTTTTFTVTNGKDGIVPAPKPDAILFNGSLDNLCINTTVYTEQGTQHTINFSELADCKVVVLDGFKLGDTTNSTDLHVAFDPYLLKHSYKLKVMASGAKGWTSDIIIAYTGDDKPITWETVTELNVNKEFGVTKITKHY